MDDGIPSSLMTMDVGHVSARELDILARFFEHLDRVGQIEITQRLEALRTILTTTFNELGFKHVTYHVARSSGITGNGRLPYILSNYPDSWVRHYFREHYLDDDPVVSRFLCDRRPFIWSQLGGLDDLNRRQRRLFDEARDAGLSNGITVPIHGRAGVAALSAIPDGRAREAEADRNQQLLRLMGLPYHMAACSALLEKSLTGDSSRRRSLLSPRETEVLQWTAKGKSTWEIAVVLGISEKSIEFHMEAAKRKLQVFNRTHAVAKAIMLDLLSLD
jgi:DNA-binding CsgD family transcriptional regulator